MIDATYQLWNSRIRIVENPKWITKHNSFFFPLLKISHFFDITRSWGSPNHGVIFGKYLLSSKAAFGNSTLWDGRWNPPTRPEIPQPHGLSDDRLLPESSQLGKEERNKWATKKNLTVLLSLLFNSDPYNGLWNNPHITSYNWVV